MGSIRSGIRASLQVLSLSGALLAPMARADVIPFVDNYKTNVSTNTTPQTNAAIQLLSGYSTLWSAGTSWDTGAPTALGASVLEANQKYVVDTTLHRTADQAESAYFTDRRNQSYSAINGLGALADIYRAAAGATTTITTIAPNATIAKYNDVGTGAGLTSSPSIGSIVSLVNTLRGNFSSTTPAKNFFKSPRPWRLSDDFRVVTLGTESTGYYTSDLSDGTPDFTAGLSFFPLYQSDVIIPPTLLAVRSLTPASDGAFVSGHTNAGYLASFAMAYAMPAECQSLLLNASNIGQDRIAAGMHLPLDVIGGRMLSTALAAAILQDPDNAALKAAALAQGNALLAASAPTVTDRFSELDHDHLTLHRRDQTRYQFRLTYGLPATDSEDRPAIVPKGAEVLLETRQPYLTAEQRREVLRTTEIDSGLALADDSEGWGRLNLYAAADGYGAFATDTAVNMDGSLGGSAARDLWRNDIGGPGKLTKQGTGELDLTGENSYRGGTEVDAGVLVAASPEALGRGAVTVVGGKLVDFAPFGLRVNQTYTQSGGGTLELVVGGNSRSADWEGPRWGGLVVHGNVELAGHLQITLIGDTPHEATIPLILFEGARRGTFQDVTVTGLARSSYSLIYSAHLVALQLRR